MMGNVRTKDRKQKEEAEKRIKDLEMQGHFKDEIGKIIMAEYREALDGKHLLDKMNLIYKNKFHWFILKARLEIVSKKLAVVLW